MDFVTCPSCGQVQARAEDGKCIKCGAFIQMAPKEKKEELREEGSSRKEDAAIGVERPAKKRKSKRVAGVVTLISLLVVGAVCTTLFMKIQRKKEYIDALYDLQFNVVFGGSEAEDLGNLTRDVWYDAIFEEYNTDTWEYVRGETGSYVIDFNDAIRNLSSDPDIKSQKAIISASLEAAGDAMDVLKNPPGHMREYYELAFDLYTEFSNLCNLAINPSGSLQSYTDDFREVDGEVADLYERLEVIMPEKIVFPWESEDPT